MTTLYASARTVAAGIFGLTGVFYLAQGVRGLGDAGGMGWIAVASLVLSVCCVALAGLLVWMRRWSRANAGGEPCPTKPATPLRIGSASIADLAGGGLLLLAVWRFMNEPPPGVQAFTYSGVAIACAGVALSILPVKMRRSIR